ncbi:MAG: hypothetical protein AVDCRST_MAG74-2093 [uncultured Pyrinomonadaceae bacterium]|uniref:Uncharacterized protein n=1 Tax=uncultured Pyrinomonadaceae bacterium TaxID=2283094 RepID=A0A6J4PA83_9BACT|nr:MAG: hypothetical protein AVDCRST_MAG74-2093 [uncultured Pyrinomonadaceae bacterium]
MSILSFYVSFLIFLSCKKEKDLSQAVFVSRKRSRRFHRRAGLPLA